jgi:tRNA threonylcarbamoyladenosine biosynthesis protein TsaB
MITLALDASTYGGDVAVLSDSTLLAESAAPMKGAEHERLMPTVAETLKAAGLDVNAIDRVVCGAGPGSFTSLRIAGAIAKGIATGLGRPLYAVSSMALIVAADRRVPGRYLAAIDALRNEFYVALYDVLDDGGLVERERARLVAAVDVDALAEEYGATVIGPSAREGAIIASPRARSVLRLEPMLVASGPVDVARWEPAYGRLAEAQVKWESAHGRPLPIG